VSLGDCLLAYPFLPVRRPCDTVPPATCLPAVFPSPAALLPAAFLPVVLSPAVRSPVALLTTALLPAAISRAHSSPASLAHAFRWLAFLPPLRFDRSIV
jgi:hypothetical protein